MTEPPRVATLLRGDGVGPEVTDAVLSIFEKAGARVVFEEVSAGLESQRAQGDPLPPEVLDSIRKNGTALKGPLTTPVGGGFKSVNVRLRQNLDLYANLRPVSNFANVPTRFTGVDLVIVRENTEDLYAGLEHVVVPGVVESLKIITEKASTRIARFAFEYALKHGRRRVTVVHKANIMKLSDGLFLECFRRVAAEYTEIRADERIVDALCMDLVLRPETYDVLLLENLYGDIVSDLAAGLVGGLGVVGSANLGLDYAVFEAVHGSAPDIAGKDLANPTALLVSAIMMLDHFDQQEAAGRIRRALEGTYAAGIRTKDLGGAAGTKSFTRAILDRL
ncbi:MAG TPA: isocitrate/isopropylmalate family dehydrogenase [Thermoanaerobaculia bacterium]|jgi:isocitrate dehydrogenase (NAD+)|nr:isocitrate/isopropylmalate family dehydrogenase [Thermoanaerobaculia bacterium]